ncbi:hypothetical protein EMIT053CA3_90184 [Pseudomonas donghuensis]
MWIRTHTDKPSAGLHMKACFLVVIESSDQLPIKVDTKEAVTSLNRTFPHYGYNCILATAFILKCQQSGACSWFSFPN